MNAISTPKGYSYNALKNILTVSAAFLKRASVLNSPEYKIILKCRHDNPGVQIVSAEHKNKPARKSITFKQMEAYIAIFDDEHQTLKARFDKIKQMAQIQASPYKYVKTWFEAQFPDYQEQVEFDENGKMHHVKKDAQEAAAENRSADEQETEQAEFPKAAGY